jgi:small subunit ribosomal protein S17
MKVHDEFDCQVGDLVEIIESKPISRTKRWAVEKIISRKNEQVVTQPEIEPVVSEE